MTTPDGVGGGLGATPGAGVAVAPEGVGAGVGVAGRTWTFGDHTQSTASKRRRSSRVWEDPQTKRKRSEGRPLQVSAVFDLVRCGLKDLADEGRIPRQLTDALDRRISAIFDHPNPAERIRSPHRRKVSAEEAEAGLLLFPGFHSLVSELVTALTQESTPIETP